MSYQEIHERAWYDIGGITAELYSAESVGEPCVRVTFTDGGFIFGETTRYSDAKMQACKLLKKHYKKMRVVDMEFNNRTERVTELWIAERKTR